MYEAAWSGDDRRLKEFERPRQTLIEANTLVTDYNLPSSERFIGRARRGPQKAAHRSRLSLGFLPPTVLSPDLCIADRFGGCLALGGLKSIGMGKPWCRNLHTL
jgi:hypothetical protein